MEMVTAMLVIVNARLIMNMPKIARIMDVSTYSKPLCFLFARANSRILDHMKTLFLHFPRLELVC